MSEPWVVVEILADVEVESKEGGKKIEPIVQVVVGPFDDGEAATKYVDWSRRQQGHRLRQIASVAMLPIPAAYLMVSTHPDSVMTHNVCDDCWPKQQPDREAYRIKDREVEICCYCGTKTESGIYYRDYADPGMHCLVEP